MNGQNRLIDTSAFRNSCFFAVRFCFCHRLLKKLECYCGNEHLLSPPNVLQLFFSLPARSIFPHQGDVGIPGEQGEIGFKGDKVDHHGNRQTCYVKRFKFNSPAYNPICNCPARCPKHAFSSLLFVLCSGWQIQLSDDNHCVKNHLPRCLCASAKSWHDRCRVTGEILGRTCMSNVWVLAEQITVLFFPLLNYVWLSVLVVMCCVCVGQGVQGPPGLQGIQGKPGPQVSSCCDEQNFAYMQTWRNNGRVTPLQVLLIK